MNGIGNNILEEPQDCYMCEEIAYNNCVMCDDPICNEHLTILEGISFCFECDGNS